MDFFRALDEAASGEADGFLAYMVYALGVPMSSLSSVVRERTLHVFLEGEGEGEGEPALNLQASAVLRLLGRTGEGPPFTYRFELAMTMSQAADILLTPGIAPRADATGSFTATLVGPAEMALPASPSVPLITAFDVDVTMGSSGIANLGFSLSSDDFPRFAAASRTFSVSAVAPAAIRTDIKFGGLTVNNPPPSPASRLAGSRSCAPGSPLSSRPSTSCSAWPRCLTAARSPSPSPSTRPPPIGAWCCRGPPSPPRLSSLSPPA